LSVDQAPNEVFMSDFQVCDVRAVPVGHKRPPGSGASIREFVPLYHGEGFLPLTLFFGLQILRARVIRNYSHRGLGVS
jgi:hypothetical protein